VKRRHPGQQGYLLISVSLALFVIAAISLSLNEESLVQNHRIGNELENRQLHYLLEAGMQQAQWSLRRQGCGPFSDIPATSLGEGQFSARILPDNAGALIHNYRVEVSDDSTIDDNNADSNFGNDGNLTSELDVFPAGNKHALLKFDLGASGIPANAQIQSATLWLYQQSVSGVKPIDIHRVTSDWSEATITWNSFNATYDTAVEASIPEGLPENAYSGINLTGLVQSWINGSLPNQGIVLIPNASFYQSNVFSSKEAGAQQTPWLEVVVSETLNTRADIEVTATLNNGITETRTRTAVPLLQPRQTLSLQPDPGSGKDGWVDSSNPNDNFGSTREMVVDGSGAQKYFIGQFDLSDIPHGARILSARLELYLAYIGNLTTDAAFSLHALRQSWSEGTGDFWNPGDGVSWNTSDGSTAWNWDDNHWSEQIYARSPVNPDFVGWQQWDASALVQQWVNGSLENHGFLIKGNAVTVGAGFYSSDYTKDPLKRPRLTIEYSCVCGTVCQAPSGNGRVLMVIGNSTQPGAIDQRKRRMLEDWGYTVTLIDDDATQTEFDNAFQTSDVIWITASADSGALGYKLRTTTLGIVNSLQGEATVLGLSSSENLRIGQGVSITDNSHVITAPFASGDSPLFGELVEILQLDGSPAPGLQTLGEIQGQPALAAIEPGATLDNGNPAAGPRVQLPFPSGRLRDWSLVGNNARLLLQRSMQWAQDTATACRNGTLRDDFDVESWSNNDGSLNWKTPWQEQDDAGAGPASGKLSISKGQLIMVGPPGAQGDEPVLARAADLGAFGRALLRFDFSTSRNVETVSDDIVVEVSTDGGSNWIQIGFFAHVGGNASGSREYDITPFISSDTRIRFRVAEGYDGARESFSIEFVEITALCALPVWKPQKIYWTDDHGGQILRSDSNGANIEIVLDGLDDPKGLDIDTVSGKLYWSNGYDILRADLDGSNIETIVTGWLPMFDVRIDTGGGKIYWTYDGIDQLQRANLDGSGVETLTTQLDGPGYISLAPADDLIWVTEFIGGEVSAVRMDGQVILTKISDQTGIVGNAFDRLNRRIFWSSGATDDWIKRANIDGSDPQTLVTGLNAPQGVAYQPGADRIYWTDALNRVVQRASADGSEVETLVSGLTRPRGILLIDADRVPPTGTHPARPCSGQVLDRFDQAAYDNNDGNLYWRGPWQEINESDGPEAGDEMITSDNGDNRLRVQDNDGGGEGIARSANLDGAGSATLSLLYRRDGLDDSNDYVKLEISSQGDAGPWTELARFSGSATDSDYQSWSGDISAHAAADTRIRLVSSSALGFWDKVYFDDIRIECSP
jgi:hypothetical protein